MAKELNGRAPDAGTPLLEVKDLEVVYKTDENVIHAVNGISFSLNERETIGLVGETGAGKSTTALSILRLLPERTGHITNGEILFRGENLLKKNPAEIRLVRGAEISIIFQDPMTALNPVLTVGSQVRESLEIHNYDNKSHEELDARVDELFNLVGIPADRKKEYPHQFSGGMKQRIVIGNRVGLSAAIADCRRADYCVGCYDSGTGVDADGRIEEKTGNVHDHDYA